MYTGNRIWCPCKKCANTNFVEVNSVCKHIFNWGFTPTYIVWTVHGEQLQHLHVHQDDDDDYIYEENNTVQENAGE